MTGRIRALQMSAALHLGVAVVVFAVGGSAGRPVVLDAIDVTLHPAFESGTAGSASTGAAGSRSARTAKRPAAPRGEPRAEPAPEEPVAVPMEPRRDPIPREEPAVAVRPDPAPAPPPAAERPGPLPAFSPAATGTARAGGAEQAVASAGAPRGAAPPVGEPAAEPASGAARPTVDLGGPSGAAPGGAGKPRAGPMERRFSYIRDSIQKNLGYPPAARRMGWQGKVVVSFTVRGDGAVEDVRVVRSSGLPILDRSAMDAVKRAAPFRRPPVEAEIVTPIVYRLE